MSGAAMAGDRLPGRVKLVIGLMLVSAFIVILNETLLGVALPHLMSDLDISAGIAQWLTTAYLLTMAIVIPLSGRVLERFSTRSVYMSALALFTVGTVIAAVAPGFGVLLLGRIVQASGTALVLPLLTTTVLNYVPAARRGRMMGLISIVISVAPAIGPTLSGVVLDSLSWRWLFILMVPIGIVALVVGAILVTNVSTTKNVRFDVLSIVLAILGFGGWVYGLNGIGEASTGHSPVSPVIPIAVSLVSLTLFCVRQVALEKRDLALMNLRPFTVRAFSVPVALIVMSFLVLFGSLILLPIYIQNVLGLDTLHTGLMLLPGGLAMGVAAPFVGRLFDRFGPRPLVIPGAALLSAAVWALTTLGIETSASLVIGIHVLLSLALALLVTPLMTAALGSLPRPLYPHGSAIVSTLQQVGGAAGTALFIALLTIGASSGQLGQTSAAAQAAGVHLAFLVGAVISLVGVGLSFFVTRPVEGASDGLLLH